MCNIRVKDQRLLHHEVVYLKIFYLKRIVGIIYSVIEFLKELFSTIWIVEMCI